MSITSDLAKFANSANVLATAITVNTTAITAVNVAGVVINSSGYTGSANNASYLGGAAAANYVQNTDSRVMSGNVNFTGTNNYFSATPYINGNKVDALNSATVLLFQQTASPTGWTKSTTHNDKALRVVSGAASSGGSVAFSSAFASQSVSGTVGSTTLTTTQMPSHSHSTSIPYGHTANPVNDGRLSTSTNVQSNFNYGSSSAGGDGSHNHGFTGTAINLAVNYVDVILASKD